MRLRELNSKSLRGLRTFSEELHRCKDEEEFKEVFADRMPRLIPAEFHNLNTLSPDLSAYYEIECTNGFGSAARKLQSAFQKNLPHFPMLRKCGLAAGMKILMTTGACTSDYASDSEFRNNVLYDEVYRPLDTNYQMLMGIGISGGRSRFLGVNRKQADFSGLEREKILVVTDVLRRSYRLLEERERLIGMIEAVASIWDLGPDVLNQAELRLMGELVSLQSVASVAAQRGVRRDTVEKQTAIIRRKLGVGNTNELLAKFLLEGPQA